MKIDQLRQKAGFPSLSLLNLVYDYKKHTEIQQISLELNEGWRNSA
jgi:hypothetical protein